LFFLFLFFLFFFFFSFFFFFFFFFFFSISVYELDEISYAMLVRCLCTQRETEPVLYIVLDELLSKTTNEKVFRYCLQSSRGVNENTLLMH
jgi:hypothetical protein